MGDLSFDLHALTARLDRSADRILQAEFGLSYQRFLALVVLDGIAPASQRALAEGLGVSEPSVSRMTGVLADAGLIEAQRDPGGGNRRRLTLTPAGKELVDRCRELLERRFAALVERSRVPYESYARHTRLLMDALDAAAQEAGR